jgi:hypothetical protein
MWIVECGSVYRFPFVPAVKSTVAMLAQEPTQIVAMSQRTSCIVS